MPSNGCSSISQSIKYKRRRKHEIMSDKRRDRKKRQKNQNVKFICLNVISWNLILSSMKSSIYFWLFDFILVLKRFVFVLSTKPHSPDSRNSLWTLFFDERLKKSFDSYESPVNLNASKRELLCVCRSFLVVNSAK